MRRAIQLKYSFLMIGLLLYLALLVACRQPGGDKPGLAPAVPQPTPTPLAFPPPVEPVTAVQLVKVAEGLRKPTAMTHAGDGRFFVAEQKGQIRIIDGGELLPEPFLDVSDILATDGSERGLLGLAFHPNYADNGWFYIVYTNQDGDTEIARYQADPENPNRADPGSATLILFVEQPYGNHNGGQLLFGPDGYLYIGLGDGGAVGDPYDNAQDAGTVLGALLRLDVDSAEPYAIPPDNPFVGRRGKLGEVWAIGLRNPWSFSFDSLTGDLYIADVGQEGPEEIDFQPGASGGGQNYGWPVLEGSACYEADSCRDEGFTPPIFEYPHSDGCAIIGGQVYRGRQFPEMAGNYFFADFCLGTIWALVHRGDGVWERTAVYQPETQVSIIAQDVNGELYAVFYRTGEVYQITSGRGGE